MSSFWKTAQRYDLYRRIPKDYSESSSYGALFTIVTYLFIIYLIFSEFYSLFEIDVKSDIYVNDSNEHYNTLLQVNIDISYHAIPCSILSLDVQDILGSHIVDYHNAIFKYRLLSNGQEVIDSVEHQLNDINVQFKNEGCKFKGFILVKKVPGNFHVSSHSHQEFYAAYIRAGHKMNVTHTVNHLSFGEVPGPNEEHMLEHITYSPLDGSTQVIPNADNLGTIEYYIKIVPTFLHSLYSSSSVYQFTSQSNLLPSSYAMPAVYFRWDFSPLTVAYNQSRPSWTAAFIRICSMIGGVVALSGVVVHAVKEFKQD